MTQRILLAVSAGLLLIQIPALAKPKRKEFDNPAAEVFAAAVKAAREHQVVTAVDDQHRTFTFETGRSSLTSGFIVNASVEAVDGAKAALVLNVQHKPGDGLAFNAGDRMADKFYEQVSENLGHPAKSVAEVKAAPTPAPTPAPAPNNVPPRSASGDYGTVAVTCSIESADVTVDGAFVGNLPASLRLAPGKHAVQVSLAGYKAWSREITVMAGAELRLIATLTKE
jgi:hypothetical protein